VTITEIRARDAQRRPVGRWTRIAVAFLLVETLPLLLLL
jgi:hypothetical protein